MNYIYKITKRGLFSELNSLHGFYNDTKAGDSIFIDGSKSQYFKNVSIYDVFALNERFCSAPQPGGEEVSSSRWTKAALRSAPKNIAGTEIFRLSETASLDVNMLLSSICLPEHYYCFHIRRGDKVQSPIRNGRQRRAEAKRYEFDRYLRSARLRFAKRQAAIFIMTDDYNTILEARQFLHDNGLRHRLFYLADDSRVGHSTIKQVNAGYSYSWPELIALLSEVEAAKRADQFVGTESSNIFRFIRNVSCGNVAMSSLD